MTMPWPGVPTAPTTNGLPLPARSPWRVCARRLAPRGAQLGHPQGVIRDWHEGVSSRETDPTRGIRLLEACTCSPGDVVGGARLPGPGRSMRSLLVSPPGVGLGGVGHAPAAFGRADHAVFVERVHDREQLTARGKDADRVERLRGPDTVALGRVLTHVGQEVGSEIFYRRPVGVLGRGVAESVLILGRRVARVLILTLTFKIFSNSNGALGGVTAVSSPVRSLCRSLYCVVTLTGGCCLRDRTLLSL